MGEVNSRDGLKRVFGLYDANEDGVIDFDELRHIAKTIHDGINDEDLLELMHTTHVSNKTATG